MTKISQRDRTRPRHELAGASHPADPARPASVARGITNAMSGLASPLANRRSTTTGGALAPRAALPPVRAAGTPSLHELLRSPSHCGVAADTPASGVELSRLPPVPRVRDPGRDWHNMWRKAPLRREQFEPLRLQYQQTLPKPISGALFLRKVNELTGESGARAFTSARADTTQFIVHIPGVEEPVRLLRRDADDGTLGDLVRLTAGSEEEIAQALEAITRRHTAAFGRRDKVEMKNELAEVANASLPGVPNGSFLKGQVERNKAHKQICQPLLDRYVASTGKPTTMAAFIERAFRLTASAQKLPTKQSDIGHFIIRMPGIEEPLHVLRRETPEGMLAGFRLVESGDPDAVSREVADMFRCARFVASRKRSKDVEAPSTGIKPRHLPKEFNDIYKAFTDRPENLNIAEGTFHQMLCEWAHKTTGKKTGTEGIERFTVDVPHYGQVELLGHRAETGGVASVARLASEAELEHKLARMVQNAKNSRGGASHNPDGVVRYRPSEEAKRRASIWGILQRQMRGELTTWKKQHGGSQGAGAFITHLEGLCAQSARDVVVTDDEKSITRHRIKPNPGGPTLTMLRCTNAAGVVTGMRVIDATQTEKHAVEAMSTSLEHQSQGPRPKRKRAGGRRVLDEALDRIPPKQQGRSRVLQRAMEGMLTNKRDGEKNLLAGLDNAAELRSWFREDGSLEPKRTAWSFLGLKGFHAARESMVSLLTQLGHHDVVNDLPAPMTAELLVKVLRTRAEHPEADTDELMRMIGAPAVICSGFVSLSTGALSSNTGLRSLPGYEAHWTEIRDALYQLGHTTQAGHLRGPVSDPTERLIYDIEDDMYALQKALHMMREEGLPRLKAARRAGMSNAALLRVLADKKGHMRNLQFIASRLPGDISPEMASRLGAAASVLSH